jgi:hypothetical protein
MDALPCFPLLSLYCSSSKWRKPAGTSKLQQETDDEMNSNSTLYYSSKTHPNLMNSAFKAVTLPSRAKVCESSGILELLEALTLPIPNFFPRKHTRLKPLLAARVPIRSFNSLKRDINHK